MAQSDSPELGAQETKVPVQSTAPAPALDPIMEHGPDTATASTSPAVSPTPAQAPPSGRPHALSVGTAPDSIGLEIVRTLTAHFTSDPIQRELPA